MGWRNRKGSAAARPKTQYRESASTLQRTNHAQRGQREEKDPAGAREQEGGVEGEQGLRCGEANPNLCIEKSAATHTGGVNPK